MPRNHFQRAIYVLLTILVTVCLFVFYSLYVVNGKTLLATTGAVSVLEAIRQMGGVWVFGRPIPIWNLLLIELCLAFLLDFFMADFCAYKLASRAVDLQSSHPVMAETAIICATVCIMCPAMSLLAAIMFYPYASGFHFLTFIAEWLRTVCFNFPLALFGQLFFIQPFVRMLFRRLFYKDLQARQTEEVPLAQPEI